MKRRNEIAEEVSAKAFLEDCLLTFRQNKDITKLTVGNDYGSLSVRRNSEKTVAHAIGFQADWGDEDGNGGEGAGYDE